MASSGARVPAKDAALVLGRVSKGTRSQLAEAAGGTVAPMPDLPGAVLVQTKRGSARKLFGALNRVVGDTAVVVPVLVDRAGNRLYPTGTVLVRFKDTPRRGLIADFARRYGLGRARRNAWASEQVAFALRRDDARFLPDIVREIGAAPGVAQAWADTRAHYRRAK